MYRRMHWLTFYTWFCPVCVNLWPVPPCREKCLHVLTLLAVWLLWGHLCLPKFAGSAGATPKAPGLPWLPTPSAKVVSVQTTPPPAPGSCSLHHPCHSSLLCEGPTPSPPHLLSRQILKANSFYRLLLAEENCFTAVVSAGSPLLQLLSPIVCWPLRSVIMGQAWSIPRCAVHLVWRFSWQVSKLREPGLCVHTCVLRERLQDKAVWSSATQAPVDRLWRTPV